LPTHIGTNFEFFRSPLSPCGNADGLLKAPQKMRNRYYARPQSPLEQSAAEKPQGELSFKQ